MIPLEDINQLNLKIANSRYLYNGKEVARVTAITSKMIHEDSIVQWSNSLGFRHLSYKNVLKEAADIGTYTHEGIEAYLKQEVIPDTTPLVPLDSFKLWWVKVNTGNRIEILGQEQSLVCPYFGGTYDLLMKINDAIYLVDFKTSNHVTYKYYLQLAAYNYLLKQQGISIHGVIILQLKKDKPAYNEYVLDLSNPRHKDYFDICERTFLSLVYSYYHVFYLEEEFKHEFQSKEYSR